MRRVERSVYFLGAVAISVLGFSVYNAKASGFDNMGIGSMDLLFDPAKFALEFGATYVNRNVDYKASNAQTARDFLDDDFPPNVRPVEGGATKVDALPDVWNYAVSAKADLTEYFTCLARVNNPGTILEEVPEDWNGRLSMIKTELQSLGIDATCSININTDNGKFRVIGGARYLETDINVFKLSNLVGAGSPAGVDLSGRGYGWRAGISYEIPQYAIRASLFYDAQLDIEAEGAVNSLIPLDGRSEFSMPAGVEMRLQSGIAPGWLAFMGVKWVDWSSLDKLTVNGSVEGQDFLKVERIFNFSDGWTVTAGVGHQFSEKIQVGSSLTWDQGIGGSYSDTYQWALGGSYKVSDNVTWSLGGAVIYKTEAKDELVSSVTQLGPDTDGIVLVDQYDLSYDSSFNFALTSKLKLSF